MYVTGLSLDLSNLREHNFNLLSANLTKRENTYDGAFSEKQLTTGSL